MALAAQSRTEAKTLPADTPAVKAAGKREIWITGVAMALAKQELQAKGSTVVEKRTVSSK